MTIAEASAATGLTEKALRRRVERGSLRSTRGHDGRVRVLVPDLEDAGLLSPGGAARGHVPLGDAPAGNELVRELVTALREQERELAELRLITQEAESLKADRSRLEQELFAARSEADELRQRLARRRWFRRAA